MSIQNLQNDTQLVSELYLCHYDSEQDNINIRWKPRKNIISSDIMRFDCYSININFDYYTNYTLKGFEQLLGHHDSGQDETNFIWKPK